jgi:hypothetical protein
MAIIDKSEWKIHPKVIEFWEKRGKILQCYGDYWEYNGQHGGGATYFYEEGVPQIGISSGDTNAIARHDCDYVPEIIYILDGSHYTEEDILKIIKMPAFI